MLRRQKEIVRADLNKKIVFLVGPRQTGKTWLAKEIGKEFSRTEYLNYDRLAERAIIEKEAWVDATDLLILDELHKMPNGKNYLKGLYDTKNERLKILVTGSARLDYFRQSGDSLAGRFFTHRLLPFSLGELVGTPYASNIDRLLERGGFPEPFLAETPEDAARWRNEYAGSLLRDEVTDLEKVADLRALRATLLVETKLSDDVVAPHLRHFCEKYALPGVQVVKELKRERKESELITVRRAKDWLAELY